MQSRFRFGPFILSPSQRLLAREGVEVPLIPRCFDLLVLLVSHRNRAISRQDIFDHVWKDVVVSDGALSQAIRTIRRALDDDPREARFVRTVARHGYQFVFRDVLEEDDGGDVLPRGRWHRRCQRAVPIPIQPIHPGAREATPRRSRRSSIGCCCAARGKTGRRPIGAKPPRNCTRWARRRRWSGSTGCLVLPWLEPS